LHNRILTFAILFLFSILFISNVYGWVLITQTGFWKDVSLTNWHKQGWNEGYIEWQQNLTDFNGFWIYIETLKWENWHEWYQFGILSIGETTNDFWVKIKITTENGTLWVVTNFHGKTAYFGLISELHDYVGASINATDWDEVTLHHPNFEGYDFFKVQAWNPPNVQIFILNEDGQAKVYWFFDIPDQENKYAYIQTFNQTLGVNATVTLIYQHGGQGETQGTITQSFTLPSFPLYEMKGKGTGPLGIFNWLTAATDWGVIGSTILACLLIFATFVKLSIPLLGIFAFFWIIDCISSAVTHGEPRIIGDMVMTIYDFVRGLWQTLVNMLSALWDVITFWS